MLLLVKLSFLLISLSLGLCITDSGPRHQFFRRFIEDTIAQTNQLRQHPTASLLAVHGGDSKDISMDFIRDSISLQFRANAIRALAKHVSPEELPNYARQLLLDPRVPIVTEEKPPNSIWRQTLDSQLRDIHSNLMDNIEEYEAGIQQYPAKVDHFTTLASREANIALLQGVRATLSYGGVDGVRGQKIQNLVKEEVKRE